MSYSPCYVGTCQHGIGCPWVADSRQVVNLQLGGWARG